MNNTTPPNGTGSLQISTFTVIGIDFINPLLRGGCFRPDPNHRFGVTSVVAEVSSHLLDR